MADPRAGEVATDEDGGRQGSGVTLRAEGLLVRRGARAVVSGVSLELRSRSLLAVVGPNGAGKTTLLRALLGLERIDGQLTLEGRELIALDARARARALGYVPQQSVLHGALPAEAVVAQGRYCHGGGFAPRAADQRAVAEALGRVGATALAGRAFPALSLGEQRRVLLARALATGARTLLLDEPDAFLDVAQALRLFALLRTLRDEGYALLVVLHGLGEVRALADRCLVLAAGTPVAYGPTAEALTPEVVRAAFGVEAVEGGAPAWRLAE